MFRLTWSIRAISDLERPAASIDRISFTVSRGTVISSILPGRARQSNRPGKPYGEGRAPGPRGEALLLKLLNFSCSRCLFPSDHSDHFLVNINRTSEGNTVWLYEPNGGPAQAWLLAGPAIPRTVGDGSYRLAAALDARMAVSASASGCSLSSGAGALSLERDGATGLYRVSSGGLMLTESGNRAVLAEADGSASQLWRVSALGGGRYSFTSASGLALDDRGQRTSEGNTVWLYEPNGGPAQAWLLAGPAIPRTVGDGSYRLAAALDARMAVSASASGCSLSSGAGALSLERDGATGLYRVSSGGLMLTESGNRAVLAEADGSASQLWRVSALGGGRYSFTSASGLALDDRGQRTSEGNTVWLYKPNGGPAQAWVLT